MTEKGWQQGLYRNTPWCIVTRGGLKAGLYRDLGHDTARCAHSTRPRYGSLCAAIRPWRSVTLTARRAGARGKAPQGRMARRARHDAQGRTGERCDTAAWATIRPRASTTVRPGYPRYDQACVRLGAPVRTWVCWLGQQAVHLVHLACF